MYLLFKAAILSITLLTPVWSQWLARFNERKVYAAPFWLLLAAGLVWVLSGQIPNIHISHETNTFQEHFVGGGFYVAFLFVYFKRRFNLKTNLLFSFIALYALASALGVANELFEFAATKSGIIQIDISDTSWDLVANTTGAFIGYTLLLLIRADRLVSKRAG